MFRNLSTSITRRTTAPHLWHAAFLLFTSLILLVSATTANALTISFPITFNGNLNAAAGTYFNWSTVSGSTGYGIRDNAGTLEFKNSGGSWSSMGSVSWANVTGKSGTYSGAGVSSCGQYTNFSGGLATGVGGSYTCGGPDIAEHYDVDGEIPVVRGLIVALSDTTTSHLLTIGNPTPGESTSTPYVMTTAHIHVAVPGERERLIGAVPTKPFVIDEPGHSGNMPKDGRQLVALAGRVPIHMTLEGGPISIGDPITLSTTKSGYGMKATTPGRIVGYALAPYSAVGGGESGTDMIEVFIHIEEWHPAGQLCAFDGLGTTCITRAEFDSLLTLLHSPSR